MKRILFFALSLLVVVSCSKFDDSAIWEELDKHEDRIVKLETLCNQMNTNITSLQTIIIALQNNDYVTNIAPIKEGNKEIGYTITFAKSGSITIYHGQDGKDGEDGKDGTDGRDGQDGEDGKDGTDGRDGQDGEDGKDGVNGKDGKDGYTPKIGVKQHIDGKYYWTLDGNFLLDDNGNMIPTTGEDGASGADGKDGEDGVNGIDGITPKLKIEDGYWCLSYDNGESWQKLGKATGENGKDGVDGDNFIESITQDEEFVCFNLSNGTTIKLHVADSDPLIIQFEDEYVKSICVSNWDVNNDGEISYEEAAAVEDIENVFSDFWVENGEVLSLGNSSMISFNELKYFTGIKNISSKAFFYDINLSSITLPENLAKILDGSSELLDYRFDKTGTLYYGAFAYSKIHKIIIPDAVVSIGSYAFYNCRALKYMHIGKGVMSIGEQTFYNCKGELSLNTKLVENNYKAKPAWLNNSYFSNIVIGDNITRVGNYMFSSYDSLVSVNVLGAISSIGDYSFNQCASLKGIDLPNSVTHIGNYAFNECGDLTDVEIPGSVISIGKYAFNQCSNLFDADLSNVNTIGDYAFYCSGISGDLNFNDLVSVGEYSFYGCDHITTITLGKNVASISALAFYGCQNLKAVYCPANVPPSNVNMSFDYADPAMLIYVPKEAVAEYRKDKGWGRYASQIIVYEFD